jgi:hypothetical protein
MTIPHPLRVVTDEALRGLEPRFHKPYAKDRATVDSAGEVIAGGPAASAVLGARRANVDGTTQLQPLFRPLVGLNMDDSLWEVTVFNENRERLFDGDIADAFFQAALRQARERNLLSDEHFTVDGTLLEGGCTV